MAKGRKGKPQGATYADVLARKMAIQRGIEKCATDKALQIQIDIGVQRAMWLMVCSIADAFKIGPDRMKRDFFPALQMNSDQLERMKAETDEDYAYEKLKHRAEQVTGIDIEYMYEHEMKAAGLKLAEGGGYTQMTNADKVRDMSDDELAVFMANETYDSMEHDSAWWLDWLRQPVEQGRGNECKENE